MSSCTGARIVQNSSSNVNSANVIRLRQNVTLFCMSVWKQTSVLFLDASFAAGRSSACLLLQRSPLVSTGMLPRKGSLKATTEQIPSKQPLASSLRIHKGCTRSLGDLKVSYIKYPNQYCVIGLCTIFIYWYCLAVEHFISLFDGL